jgi:hypothetical protein
MLKIKYAMINGDAGVPAWIEIENDGGETYLGGYALKIRNADGSGRQLWQGDAETAIWGLGTIRLTDGSEVAKPVGLGEPRMTIPLPVLNLSNAPSGDLVLYWLDGDGNVKNDTVTVTAGSPSGKCLHRNGNILAALDTTPYHQ